METITIKPIIIIELPDNKNVNLDKVINRIMNIEYVDSVWPNWYPFSLSIEMDTLPYNAHVLEVTQCLKNVKSLLKKMKISS